MGRNLLDILQFVNNADQLWDFVCVERDWKSLGVQMDIGPYNLVEMENEKAEEILNLIQKDEI